MRYLVERLRGMIAPTGYGSTRAYLANPDGPEAADLIERLTAENAGLRERIEMYDAEDYDRQQGPIND